MIVLAIAATLVALVWTCFIVIANGMSDSHMSSFQGGGTLIAAWIGVCVMWLAWWFG